MDARDGVHLERPTAARVDRPAGVDGGPARPHRRWQEPIDDAGGAARGVPIGSSSVGWRLALGGARGRIQRSTVGSTDAAHSPLSPLSPLGPVEPRVRLAVGRSLGVIRRVVEKTQVGSKRNPQTKYYSSEDPNPFNPKMFDTYEEAAAYDSRLVTAKNTKPASSPTTAAAVTVDKPSAVPAKPAAVPAKPATTSAPPVPATKVPEKEPEPPSWEELWYAKQSEVVNAMAPFVARFRALDEHSTLRIRGSLASGFKGEHKALDSGARPLFDPSDFDIDAYVVSDTLYTQALAQAGTTDAVAKGKIPGSSLPAVNAIIRDLRVSLAKIPGNRDRKETWRFNVLIRSSRNASFVEGRDSTDLYDVGYDYAGYVGIPEPKTEKEGTK